MSGSIDEFHLGREREHALVADRALGEGAEPDAAVDETGRQQIGHREFRGIAVGRALLVGERLPQPVHRALRHLADDLRDVLRLMPRAASRRAQSI